MGWHHRAAIGRYWTIGFLLLTVSAAAGCAAIAGIDEARIDPKLRASSTGGKTGASGLGARAGAGGGGTSNSSGASDALCEEYCDLMMEYCGDPASGYQQFESRGICMAFCAKLPRGVADDTLVNSVWCRVKQAQLAKTAASEAETNCQAAGPGSDDITCGTKCATYCRLMREVCPTDFKANYADDIACLAECRALPAPGPYDAKPVHDGKLKTVNCRLYHLTVATVPELNSTHCPHPIGAASMCMVAAQ